MTPNELEALLATQSQTRDHAFPILKSIAHLMGENPDDQRAHSLLVRVLEYREEFEDYSLLLNALLRDSGLYPYANPEFLCTRDLLAFEFHRPYCKFIETEFVFHRVQAQVYWKLIEGKNVILSAPTSFGKSLIIDALVNTGNYKRIALVVPTIALIDETRKRLSRFSTAYKIVTHSSQPADPNRGTIYVLTQERVIEREDLDHLDLFVIDEFYKLDPTDNNDDRASILNHAFYKLLQASQQFYLLGPNIRTIPDDFESRFEAHLVVSNYTTVASDVQRVKTVSRSKESRESALIELTKRLDESTLIYCRSPASVRHIARIMVNHEVRPIVPKLSRVAEWVGKHFHPEWVVANAIAHGIGVHHGRLPRALAQLQVRLFNCGDLDYLICTSTLIEGVNTAAKHVVIYDNKISKKPIDYFTYRNIQGRSGRMFRHFVGTVHLFHEPPQPDLLDVDFPVFSQTDSASDGLLVQLNEEDLGENSVRRIDRLKSQTDLSIETIRANAHVDPNTQIQLAQHIHRNYQELYPFLSWRGQPNNSQIYKVCELLFDSLLHGVSRNAVRSHKHLAMLLTRLQSVGASEFIKEQAWASGSRILSDPSDRVENSLEFLRNWASFYFPRALSALDRIQVEVFERLGLRGGSYATFAIKIENLMLPPAYAALDEYGIPLQLVTRLQNFLPISDDLDSVLDSLRSLDVTQLQISAFEKDLLKDVQLTL